MHRHVWMSEIAGHVEHTVWCSKCTQTDSVILEDKVVPDAESVPMTLFSLDINADDEHIKYYTGLPSYAAFTTFVTYLTLLKRRMLAH